LNLSTYFGIRQNLISLLQGILPSAEIVTVLDSVSVAIEWFRTNETPDIVFMDIHLADGSAFHIFESVKINCPVIFTTGYDEYALKAFKVNSIDYLLKPIREKDIKGALDKWELFQHKKDKEESGSDKNFLRLMESMNKKVQYKTHFLIPHKGTKLLPVTVESVLFFYIKDGIVKAMTQNGEKLIIPHSLDELTETLDPDAFFRVNRQYLISKKSINDVDLWFNGRLSINLIYPQEDKILVTKSQVTDFKKWFSGA
jgi:two-component system LytT family response regulator